MWNQGGTKGGTKAFAMDFREFMVAARGLIILLLIEPDAQTWACLDVLSRILKGGAFATLLSPPCLEGREEANQLPPGMRFQNLKGGVCDTTFSSLPRRQGGSRFRYLTVQWDT